MNNTSEGNIYFHQYKSFDCKRPIEIPRYRLEDNIYMGVGSGLYWLKMGSIGMCMW